MTCAGRNGRGAYTDALLCVIIINNVFSRREGSVRVSWADGGGGGLSEYPDRCIRSNHFHLSRARARAMIIADPGASTQSVHATCRAPPPGTCQRRTRDTQFDNWNRFWLLTIPAVSKIFSKCTTTTALLVRKLRPFRVQIYLGAKRYSKKIRCRQRDEISGVTYAVAGKTERKNMSKSTWYVMSFNVLTSAKRYMKKRVFFYFFKF